MKKRRIISSVLAALTALTVTACGSVDTSSKETKDEKTKVTQDSDTTVKDSVKKVGERVQNVGRTVSQALSGELDFAYAGSAKLSFGEAFTEEAGTQIKPVTITAGTKQKGGKSQADVSLAYDTETLLSFNAVADNEAQVVYFKIPELSDAYISATPDDFKALFTKAPKFGNIEIGDGMTLDGIEDFLGDIDFDALFEDLEGYCELIDEKLPEGTDGGKLTGDIDGNAYEYDVVSYEVTGQMVYDIADSVSQKAKGDQQLKDLFAKFGVEGTEYDNAVDSFITELKSADQSELDKTAFVIDLYKNGDEPCGFNLYLPDEDANIKAVTVANDSTIGIDFSATEKGTEKAAVKGAFTDVDETVNGSLAITAEGVNANITAKDLKPEGDLFSGTITANVAYNGESFVGTVVSDSTEDKLSITANADLNGKNLLNLTVDGEPTDASDITLPSGTIYKLDKDGLDSYAATWDLEGFKARLESIFGGMNVPNII